MVPFDKWFISVSPYSANDSFANYEAKKKVVFLTHEWTNWCRLRIIERGCVRLSVGQTVHRSVTCFFFRWNMWLKVIRLLLKLWKGEQRPMLPLPNGSGICWSCIRPFFMNMIQILDQSRNNDDACMCLSVMWCQCQCMYMKNLNISGSQLLASGVWKRQRRFYLVGGITTNICTTSWKRKRH